MPRRKKTEPVATETAATTQSYKSIADKMAEQEARHTRLLAELNDAPEESKPAIQAQVSDAERKIKWYRGRLNSAKFAAKEASVKAAAVTPTPTPAATVANES